MSAESETPPVVIKKYANRRLYDTESSTYITLEDLYQRVKQGDKFLVVDAKTGHDLTRQTLAQIIFEQETKGLQMLPTNFLHSVIRFYDDGMQEVLQHYLDASMKTFLGNQERMRSMMGKAMEGFSPFTQFEEITRNNMQLFEKAFQMFTPFGMFSGSKEDKHTDDKKKR